MELIHDPKVDLSSPDSASGREDLREDLRKDGPRNGKALILSYNWILITALTLIIIISLGGNLYQARQEIQDMAITTALRAPSDGPGCEPPC
jgi:hypothetical protein